MLFSDFASLFSSRLRVGWKVVLFLLFFPPFFAVYLLGNILYWILLKKS